MKKSSAAIGAGASRKFILIALATTLFAANAFAQLLHTSVSSGAQDYVVAGTSITYDFTVFNDTGAQTNDTVLNITLPAKVSHLASIPGCNAGALPLVTCPLGAILDGNSAHVSVTLLVRDDYITGPNGNFLNGFLNFSATATSTETPLANTVVGFTPVTEVADLHITNIAQQEVTDGGAISWYTIYVDNFGPSAARGVVVQDTLLSSNDGTHPDETNDTFSIQSCAFSVSQGGGSITQFTCTTGNLVETQFGTDVGTFGTNILRALAIYADNPETPDPSDPVQFGRLRAAFRFSADNGLVITTTSRADSATPDPDTSNNLQIGDLSFVSVSDLSLVVSSSGELQPNGSSVLPYDLLSATSFPDAGFNVSNLAVTAGRRVKYTYTITNDGPSDSDNTRLISRLPAGVVVVPGSLTIKDRLGADAAGNCQFGTPGLSSDEMTCGLGTIRADEAFPPADPNLNNRRTIEFEVVANSALASGTVLTNNILLDSETVDLDNSDNLGSRLMVVSPLTGVSDCSVGGPYNNVICGNGTTELGLNGFGFALPDTGSLDIQWTSNCPGAAFDDATIVNPKLNFTTANPDNTPVSCQVNLSVQNAFASSNCSGIVNVVDCAADCFGVLDGPAKLDRCGVCEGNGQSCLGCTDVDNSSGLFDLSSGALRIRNATLKAAKKLSDTAAGAKARRTARRVFSDNLEAITRIPTKTTTCTNTNFCVQTNNVSLLEDVGDGLSQAFSGLNSTARKLKAQGLDPALIKQLLKRGKSALSLGTEALVAVPLTSSSCL